MLILLMPQEMVHGVSHLQEVRKWLCSKLMSLLFPLRFHPTARTANYGTSFSSKVTWDHILVTSSNVSWYKVIWKEHIPRNSFVSWLALSRRLPTKDRLRR
ncbi:unnamed protein product, partial [Brassica rapa subsp. narinosa]